MMISSKTIVDRYLAKKAAISEEKLQEIMLKIRKGATSSLNWKQLQGVLAVLDPGWKIEPIVGLIKLYGSKSNPEFPEWYTDENKNKVEAEYRKLASFAVTFLPSNPRHGQLYVLDLTPITERPEHGDWEFKAKPWMGSEGWKITAPHGASFETFPGKYDFGSLYHGYKVGQKRGQLSLGSTERWLNEKTDWIDQINKKLGLEKFIPSTQRTREDTGSCPVCFQNVKANPHIALHGYKRPGTGETYGRCYGVEYLPFEISVKGTKDYLEKVIEPQLQQTHERLQNLKSGEVTKLKSFRTEITPDNPLWGHILKEAVRQTEWEIKQLEERVKAYTKLVQHWKERSLPKEGEPHIDWYHQGQKN